MTVKTQCSAHEGMITMIGDRLSKAEFRWIAGIALAIILATIGALHQLKASNDKVFAIEKRQDRQERLLERIDANVMKLIMDKRN